jgi:hypothetical protein
VHDAADHAHADRFAQPHTDGRYDFLHPDPYARPDTDSDN